MNFRFIKQLNNIGFSLFKEDKMDLPIFYSEEDEWKKSNVNV